MGSEKVHSYKSLGHRTLAQMAEEVVTGGTVKIEMEAAAQAHNKLMPSLLPGTPGRAPTVEKKVVVEPIRANKLSVPSKGKMFFFRPTGEKVTVVRDKVGQAYSGQWIHEVVTREGKKFLANEQQLRGYV